MANLSSYYLWMSLAFLSIAIYNAIFFSSYSGDKCMITQVTESADGLSTTTSQTQSSIQTTKVPLVITIFYSVAFVFTLLGVLGIKKFEGVSPERFGKLGCCLGTLGCFVRNFTLLLKLLHLIIGLVIGIQFIILYGSDDCLNAKHYSVQNISGEVGKMQSVGSLVNIITGLAWFFLHFICSFLKKFIDQQPYLYEPFDSDKSWARYLCCDFFGP